MATQPMIDKTCLVTGGTAGIGYVAACELARLGARVTIVGRDARRGEAAASAIQAEAEDRLVDFIAVDLSDQQALRAFAVDYLQRTPRLDVLVNNAGGLFGHRQMSVDGIEMTFALNHLNYFLLTALLLPALRAAPAGRIVSVASEAHRGVHIDFDDLQGELQYRRWTAYRRSKLANLMFTYELARRLNGERVTANALHPGFVATDIGVRNGFVSPLLWRIGKLAAISPERGASGIIRLASDHALAGVTGTYFVEGQPARSSSASFDASAGGRLWDISVNLTGADSCPLPEPDDSTALA